MEGPEITLVFAPELQLFVPAPRRGAGSRVVTDGSATLGHVVESLGVPLTEVGRLEADGVPVPRSHVPREGERITVRPVVRPQRLMAPVADGEPGAGPRFLLDVHLGTLARRLRLLGVDAAYDSTDPGDAALAARSARERRVMLSRDRGLLHRRELWAGGYVYSHRPEEQLRDVLGRFAPPLAPWTRCTACNGRLRPAEKTQIRDRLEHGTAHTYQIFAQCVDCERVYWQGAHHNRLTAIVAEALREFGGAGTPA